MYVATRDVVTEFETFKKGDEVSDLIGKRYAAFDEIKEAKKPKEEPKEELLTEAGDADVQVEITEEV